MILFLFRMSLLLACVGLPLQAEDCTYQMPIHSTAKAPAKKKHSLAAQSKEKASKTGVAVSTPAPSVTLAPKPPTPVATTKSCRITLLENPAAVVAKAPAAQVSAPRKQLATVAKIKSMATSAHKALLAAASAAKENVMAGKKGLAGGLARITAYWAGEGDYYTGRCVSSTGIHLHGGHCAVDPRIIPYGSVVEIPGVGQFLAVDTGSAVISRMAAREAGHTKLERGALVIDLFFEHRRDGERFAASGTKFVPVSWWTPASKDRDALLARSLFADEDWNKIYSKQL